MALNEITKEDAPVEPLTKGGNDAISMAYLQGNVEPVKSSVLISNSKYLNDPYYRDAFVQNALRRYGHDLPVTYTVPLVGKALGEVTDFADFFRVLELEKQANPEFAAWLSARRYTEWKRDDMAGAEPGTLRYALWEFLGIDGVVTELQLQGVAITNDIDYITKRRGATHDLEHLISGYTTNEACEVALAFANITATANYFSPELAHYINHGLAMLLTASMQRVMLHYSSAFPIYLEAARRGIEMGQALKKPLLLEDWEGMLDWQLDDIAARLGFTRGPGDEWAWTTAAMTG